MQTTATESRIEKGFRAEEISRRFLEAAIGNTPLVRLRRVSGDLPDSVELYAKAELILEGERSGKLTPDKTILDATSGNTGIAYAMLGAARGYSVTLLLPANASYTRKQILKRYGAEIIETDPLEGTDGAQAAAREIARKNPDRFFYPDQYNNPANWLAHFATTAPEIWWQTHGRVTHFVAGLGTTGTFVGTTHRLKEFNPALQAAAVQPDSPMHGLEGVKHLETARVPGIFEPTLVDRTLEIATEDAQAMTRRLAREEGLFVGPSSGANVLAALRLAEQIDGDAVVVTVLCDGGGKYIEDSFWNE
jgi:cysteine synthase B